MYNTVRLTTIESFRSEYEYEIEYECDFQIINQLRPQSRRFSLLLVRKGGGTGNNIAGLCDHLGYMIYCRFEKLY